MSNTNLQTAIREYVDRTRTLAGLAPNDPRRTALCSELEESAQVLEAQLQNRTDRLQRSGQIHNILVAIDRSEPAQWAVDEAVRLAEGLDAKVSLVSVIDNSPMPAPEYGFDDAIRRPQLFEDARALLNETSERVPADLMGERIVREGKADKQIVETGDETHADLIVIGTHGRGLLGRFLLGSVAEAVVRHGGCPVLTVGHPRTAEGPEPYALRAPPAHVEAE